MVGVAHVHAQPYVELLRELPEAELVGWWDDGEEAVTGAPRVAALEALLAQVDAVIVCSETSRHRALVEASARAGVHVLCEKPVAPTLPDAEAMRAACAEAGVTFMTAFPMRFDAAVMDARRRLQRAELGAVLGVNGVNHSENPGAHRAWFTDPVRAGGGAVMDHVVHLADVLRWSFACEVAEVYADVRWTPGPFGPIDTAGVLLLTLENGVQASIDCSWSRPATYPRWGHLRFEVIGEDGLLMVDAFAQHLTVHAPGAARAVAWQGFSADPNRAMLRAFLSAAREGAPPPVTWLDGAEALRVALAAYDSARAGQPVRLR